EAVKAGILESEAVFGFVHAEAARAARAGGEKDVVIDDVLLGHSLRFKTLQVTNQVPHRKIGRVALAVVAEFLAGLEIGDHRGVGMFSQRYPLPWKTALIISSCFQVRPPKRMVV